MIVSSEGLVSRINLIYEQLEQQQNLIHEEMTSVVSEINTLTSSIAQLNEKIIAFSASPDGQLPNDMMDERERAVRQLSELIGTSVVIQEDRGMIITTGNGQPLVVGSRAFSLSAASSSSKDVAQDAAGSSAGT